jgi:DNA topoisomerase-3
MGKSLIIAEKPSVAGDIARALGKLKKEKDYYENEDYVVSSAIGHLVELCAPPEMEKKRGKWKFESLPVVPNEFDLQPIAKTQTRFNLLKRLIKRKDVDEIINACDAGREGELIFRYLVKASGTKKPSRRLWLQSMTPEAIREGFHRLRSDEEMIPLAKAAASRAESDWLVGINSTRALTAFNSQLGGFQLTPAGRVQTPTLAILVEREEKIRSFEPKPYFEVFGDFGVQAGNYRGRWFDESFKKEKQKDDQARAERIWDRAIAEAIREKCLGKTGEIREEKKPASQICPQLYDLTTLQREANQRFGFSAKRTLQIAQALYERYKVLTYPRTDSRYLPEDNFETVRRVMGQFEDPTLKQHADKVLASGWIKPNKRVLNDAKVTDHHAIIPTGVIPRNLDEYHQKLYDLVSRRFIAIFYPPAQFEVTIRITRVEGEAFRTDGKIIVDPGWMIVYGRRAENEQNSEKSVAAVAPSEKATTNDIEVMECETKPPPRFTEATLLSAMEGAGKLVDDEELAEAMRARGLGTPATRAAIIEGLLTQEYVTRTGRDLVATSKGISLIQLLRSLGVKALCLPELTGEWEYKLKQIEQGILSRRAFMEGIRKLTEEIVSRAKNGAEPDESIFGTVDVACPVCGSRPLKEDYRTFRCTNCDYRIWKTMAGRVFSPDEIEKLLANGEVGPLDGFRSKMGRSFIALVKLGTDKKPTFEFNNGDGEIEKDTPDLSQAPNLGRCPVCRNADVYELENAYACADNVSSHRKCSFRMGKTILQKPIPASEVQKLIKTGKTGLIGGFISKKGRPFKAFLKLEKGKIGFEFEPRSKAAGDQPKEEVASKQ